MPEDYSRRVDLWSAEVLLCSDLVTGHSGLHLQHPELVVAVVAVAESESRGFVPTDESVEESERPAEAEAGYWLFDLDLVRQDLIEVSLAEADRLFVLEHPELEREICGMI